MIRRRIAKCLVFTTLAALTIRYGGGAAFMAAGVMFDHGHFHVHSHDGEQHTHRHVHGGFDDHSTGLPGGSAASPHRFEHHGHHDHLADLGTILVVSRRTTTDPMPTLDLTGIEVAPWTNPFDGSSPGWRPQPPRPPPNQTSTSGTFQLQTVILLT